jgi:hypothetical protein
VERLPVRAPGHERLNPVGPLDLDRHPAFDHVDAPAAHSVEDVAAHVLVDVVEGPGAQ